MITSEYHSENGHDPVGQISITKYSNDPKDFGNNDDTSKKGITSITTTQKFGYKDTPSLKTLTASQKVSSIKCLKDYIFHLLNFRNYKKMNQYTPEMQRHREEILLKLFPKNLSKMQVCLHQTN